MFINTYPSLGSRAEMEKHLDEIPEYVKEEIKKGKLRFADTIIYSMKFINGNKVVKMFETQDDRRVGICNIANAKLPKNQVLLLSGIQLLAGVSPDGTKEKMVTMNYGSIYNWGGLINGEFSLKANNRTIVPETSNQAFVNGTVPVPYGLYKLDNPRLILDETQIEFTIEFASLESLPPNIFLYLALWGTITAP